MFSAFRPKTNSNYSNQNTNVSQQQSQMVTDTKPIQVQKNPIKIQQPLQIDFTQNKLRQNFAEELLNLELEIESPNLTIDTVTNLLELYREAVEYFESISSPKYLIFQNKMQSLLSKKNVLLTVQGQNQNKSKNESEPITQKQKDLLQRINYIKGQDQASQVKNFISEHNQQEVKIKEIIHSEINGQQEQLQQRLLQRRNNSVKKESGQVYVINQQSPKFVQKELIFQESYRPQVRSQIQKIYQSNDLKNKSYQNT